MREKHLKLGFLVGLFTWILFLLYQAQGIYTGDSGDLVTAAAQMGVPHPPGYPLYTFLGWLLTFVPLSTVSWRVTLLSSFPHAVTVAFVYFIVFRITKRVFPSLFAAVSLVGNYLFFLYSVTPEVFALFDLYIVALVYALVRWRETANPTYVYLSWFLWGLALTHHHLMLFLLPASVLFLWLSYPSAKRKNHFAGIKFVRCVALFFTGLLPYLYVPIAARGQAVVNWDKATDIGNFFRLVTRRDYGIFTSGSVYGQLLVERLLEVKAYWQFLVMDLTFVGIALVIFGLVWLWRHDKNLLLFFVVGVGCIGPLFFFYAGFPLINRFMLATYERFMLPSYMLLSILLGLGIHQVLQWVRTTASRVHVSLPVRVWVGVVAVAFCVYPMSLLGMNVWRFWGLPSDRTADYLAMDVLDSVPQKSIILLSRDTTLFATQYLRYATGYRSDVYVLMLNNIHDRQYRSVLARVFGELVIPDAEEADFLRAFIDINSGNHAIFTNNLIPLSDSWDIRPHGLLYRIVPVADIPTAQETIQANTSLWQRYHNPTKGILGRYNHLMLSDVRDVYTTARIAMGKFYVGADNIAAAAREFEEAISYGGDIALPDAYTDLGLSYLWMSRCGDALGAFAKARELSPVSDEKILYYEAVTYRDCLRDEVRSREFFLRWEELQRTREVQLKDL